MAVHFADPTTCTAHQGTETPACGIMPIGIVVSNCLDCTLRVGAEGSSSLKSDKEAALVAARLAQDAEAGDGFLSWSFVEHLAKAAL